jgi:SAM-dependent methyltransferase
MKPITFSYLDAASAAHFNEIWEQDPESIYAAIRDQFRFPKGLVEGLIQKDVTAMAASKTVSERRRQDSLKDKILGRYRVIGKNRRILSMMHSYLGRSTDIRYLDVGCGLGLTLHDARATGFVQADGLEIDPAFVDRANIVNDAYADPNVRVWLSDFLTHEFDCKYDLITFFDVFEHIADRELALQHARDLLTDDGIIFVYQGNFQSSEIVRTEPHYRVPALSLLEPKQQVRILKKMRKISSAADFVVCQWPKLDLFSACEGLKGHINATGKNIRGDREHTSFENALRRVRGMVREPLVWDFPGSNLLTNKDEEVLKERLTALAEQMVEDKDNLDAEAVYKKYLIGSWELVLTKKDNPSLKPHFSALV